jgi:hypothetical protein
VLCCDEKSQCQALERTQLGLPLAPMRKIIESDRSFSSNPDSHFHRKRTPVFMRVDSPGAMAAAHAEVVSGV